MNHNQLIRITAALLLAATATAARAVTVDIVIDAGQFGNDNATITVSVGDTVRWVNEDGDPHTVTSGANRVADGKFDSGNVDPNAVFTHTFTAAGSYPYYCGYHVGMESSIQVVSNAATVTIDIRQFRFGDNNSAVEVNAGDTVRWRNFDAGMTHTVTSGIRGTTAAGGLFDEFLSGSASNPGTFSYTFREVGTVPYFCRPHSNMNSSIVVKAAAPAPVRGDMNGDGATDFGDVPMCLRVCAGLEALPQDSLQRMDVAPAAGDAVFDMLDVARIARFASGADATPL